MRKTPALIVGLIVALPLAAFAQDGKTSLDAVAKAMGAASLKSFEMTANGMSYAVGQSEAPGAPWPRFHVKSAKRTVNYATASMRDEIVQVRVADPPRGGGVFVRGDQKLDNALSGEHAWNTQGTTAVPWGRGLTERQFQLWATPHGVVKAAMANKGTLEGRTISFAAPGKYRVRATVNEKNLVTQVDALVPDPVVGDQPVVIKYSAYQDFGNGIMFPRIIEQTAGGFPSLVLTVDSFKPNVPVDIKTPEAVAKEWNGFYSRVATQMVAPGVWYVTGGSHHSVVIEMKDHVVVAEAPLLEERTVAVLAEARKLVPGKPLRYLINSHHHYDHSGGVRAAAAEGLTIVTSEVNRPFFEWALAAGATVSPDRLAKSKRTAVVEGVGDKRVMTDGSRTLEIHQISGILHHDGMLMVYLPREKLLIQADAFTPVAANAKYPTPPNPFTVSLAENIERLKLDVQQHLPLHGRIVPAAELQKAIGK
jgi:glyoxylase-like metal-dependent hydrolase (beta-lactamase superfamily II)